MDLQILFAVLAGIAILLILILKFKIQAFLSLLIVSILVGIFAGLPASEILETMQEGMGSTLGFVATLVGLGALFGGILEQSGGAKSIAEYLLSKSGEKRSSWAMMLTGFTVAIPVFFDVAFIILVPVAYALSKRTGKSLLLYALPLLAGLTITHAFIPPTPGPIAVADILGADIGWVIFFGLLTGAPIAIICGPVFAKFISHKLKIEAPEFSESNQEFEKKLPSPFLIIFIIITPILLIVLKTVFTSTLVEEGSIPKVWMYIINLIGHPFTALILANILAWYFIGIKRGSSKEFLNKTAMKSFEAAGIIILLTGAGGAFKQILIETGAGDMIAESLQGTLINPLIFGFLVALLVRLLQGSATVAMITAAGITAPLIASGSIPSAATALIVIAIAAGASGFSHVNDSGFWLVGKYLGLTEKQTFRTWTVMTGLIAILGLLISSALYFFL